jgi:hypothetical protein
MSLLVECSTIQGEIMEAINFMTTCANASDSNITVLWLVEDRVSGIVTATFLLLFLVIGLPWNLLVIATIVKQRLYTQPTIILLLSLASSDLVLLVLHLPLVMIVGFHGEFYLETVTESGAQYAAK